MEAENFAQDLHSAVAEFLIGHCDVDHPVAVGHTEPDHRSRADHVQRHLLRGPGFHASRAGDDFGADRKIDRHDL